MKKISKTIAFFGSGPVAAESLKLILKSFPVEVVLTKSRPPHHKGSTPVLDISEKNNIPVLFTDNKAMLDQQIKKQIIKSKLAILIDYGIIVSQEVIDYFPLGIINSHFSLLPKWRGADPISFVILSGQQNTGVSLMLLDKGLDTGNLIAQEQIPLSPTITTPELTKKLIKLSNQMLNKYTPDYITSRIIPYPQVNPQLATYSRKLTKKDGIIDWTKPASVIEREIRAFIGWPGSRTVIFNKDVIITEAKVENHTRIPKEITQKNNDLVIAAGNNSFLKIIKLKPAGKKEMTAQEFVSGYFKKTSP